MKRLIFFVILVIIMYSLWCWFVYEIVDVRENAFSRYIAFSILVMSILISAIPLKFLDTKHKEDEPNTTIF